MTINKKIQKYIDQMEVRERVDGSEYTVIKNEYDLETHSPLYEAIRKAHGDSFPKDFIYSTFLDCLQRLSEYEINSNEKLEDVRNEVVDSMVDIYTHDLIKWLASDINNVYYLTQAIDEFECRDGFKALSMAQYLAIDEVMGYVIALIES